MYLVPWLRNFVDYGVGSVKFLNVNSILNPNLGRLYTYFSDEAKKTFTKIRAQINKEKKEITQITIISTEQIFHFSSFRNRRLCGEEFRHFIAILDEGQGYRNSSVEEDRLLFGDGCYGDGLPCGVVGR